MIAAAKQAAREYWRPKHAPLLTWGRCGHAVLGAAVCFGCSLAWGYAGLVAGVMLSALLAWSWERATHFLAPLAGWPHPYGDVRDFAAYLVGALLVAVPSAHAVTEITALPATLATNDETYVFNISGSPDSTVFNGSTALTVTGTNVTLQADGYLIARTDASSQTLVAVNATGFTCTDLRSRSLGITWTATGSTFQGCEFRTVAGALRIGTVSQDNTVFERCKFLSGSSQNALSISADATLESCLLVATARECLIVSGTPDASFINCTIVGQGGTRVPLLTDQTGGTLTLHNTILRAENGLAFHASVAAWSGLTHSHNWYGRESGSNLISYQGTIYTSGSAFEVNSRSGPLDFEDDNDQYSGDYSIEDGGTGVDIGTNTPVTVSEDVAGETRIQNTTVDMGAYESGGKPPATGACCATNGACNVTTEAGCVGTYQGDDTTCTPNPCPQPEQGACCFDDGSCVVTTQALCTQAGGDEWTEGGDCVPNECDQPGACCVGETCTITLFDECAGDWRGAGTICSPNPCVSSETGTCCFPDGTCDVLTSSECANQSGYWIEGGTCSPNICDDMGACCVGQTCLLTSQFFCEGAFQGEGSVCSPNPCLAPGCPPPGYIEITSLPLSLGLAQSGNKYAICGTLVSSASHGETSLNVSGNDIEINGFGVGRIVGGGVDQVVRFNQPRHGFTIRNLDFDIVGSAAIKINGDSAHIEDCTFRSESSGVIGFEPKAAPSDPDGIMTNCGVRRCTIVAVGPFVKETRIISMGANTGWMADAFFDDNYLHVTNPPDDGVGLQANIWRPNGSYSNSVTGNTIIILDQTATNEPIKMARVRGVHVANNYTFAPNGHFCSFRESSVDPTHHSKDLIIEENRFVCGNRALSVDADSSIVRNNVCIGGFGPRSDSFAFRVSSSVDTIRVENNLFISGRGAGVAWFFGGTTGGTVIGNTMVVGGAAIYGWNHEDDAARPGTFHNNIFVALNNAIVERFHVAPASGFTATHNLYRAGSGGTLINWGGTVYNSVAAWNAATGHGANSIGSDPLFVNARADSLGDFHLQDLSPAIDAGDSTFTTVTVDLDSLDRVIGDNVDMGAYEFGSVVPTLNGACCFADGTCQVTTEAACESLGGTYQGDNTVCSPNPCPEPTGACCFFDGSCVVDEEDDCIAADGEYQGDGVTCAEAACEGSGACCFADGTCVLMLESECADILGDYQGDGSSCVPNLCPLPQGACCVDTLCYQLEASECVDDSSGTYQGDGTVCTEDLCDEPAGACCYDSGLCQVQTESECLQEGGTYQGDDTGCSPNPCAQPLGACCIDGECSQITQAACDAEDGLWYGVGQPCVPTLCPAPTGACCLPTAIPLGLCVVTTEAACAAVNGLWTQGIACDAADCEEFGVRSGRQAIVYPSDTWITTFGEDAEGDCGVPIVTRCDDDEMRLGTPIGEQAGYAILRFDIPDTLLPAGAVVVDAKIEVVVTNVSGTTGDMEVYPLRDDPDICAAHWACWDVDEPWTTPGALHIPQDRLLPALADQMASGAAEGDTLTVEGPLARNWAWEDLLPDGTASVWISLEAGRMRIGSAESLTPPRLILTYALLDFRRRATLQSMGRE